MKSTIYFLSFAMVVLFSFGSCKSKESAYKAAYEKAKEKEMQEQQTVRTTVNEVTPVGSTTASFQKEKLTTIDGSGLKQFNVVIGSFTNRTNAVSLKERMTAQGYQVILAQNERQMYRVIVASFDNKAAAAQERDVIKARYAPDFQDAWLLENN